MSGEFIDNLAIEIKYISDNNVIVILKMSNKDITVIRLSMVTSVGETVTLDMKIPIEVTISNG